MGKVDLGIKIAERIGVFAKSCSRLSQKSIPITKDTIFAYKPNYDKAVSSWSKELSNNGYNNTIAQRLAKLKVREDMITWGRPLESTTLMRRSSDPKLLELPNGNLGEEVHMQ